MKKPKKAKKTAILAETLSVEGNGIDAKFPATRNTITTETASR